MNRRIILEIESNGNAVDKVGYIVGNVSGANIVSFENEATEPSKTVELVKLGVSVDEIIKLKNMELI